MIIYAHEPSIVPRTAEIHGERWGMRCDGWMVLGHTRRAPGKRVPCKRIWCWSRVLYDNAAPRRRRNGTP